MDDTRAPSACDRTVKVSRSFEWSRLENELMNIAYEQILPIGRRRPDQRGERLAQPTRGRGSSGLLLRGQDEEAGPAG